MEGHWKFLGEGRILEVKILEAKYEAKLAFPGGRGGAKQKNFPQGGELVFYGTAHCNFQNDCWSKPKKPLWVRRGRSMDIFWKLQHNHIDFLTNNFLLLMVEFTMLF